MRFLIFPLSSLIFKPDNPCIKKNVLLCHWGRKCAPIPSPKCRMISQGIVPYTCTPNGQRVANKPGLATCYSQSNRHRKCVSSWVGKKSPQWVWSCVVMCGHAWSFRGHACKGWSTLVAPPPPGPPPAPAPHGPGDGASDAASTDPAGGPPLEGEALLSALVAGRAAVWCSAVRWGGGWG